jgi:hypothetical protein
LRSRYKSPLAREAVVVLAKHGHAAEVDLEGEHFKIRWVQGDHNHFLVIARTASDRRAAANSRAVLRRLLQAGHPS